MFKMWIKCVYFFAIIWTIIFGIGFSLYFCGVLFDYSPFIGVPVFILVGSSILGSLVTFFEYRSGNI